MKTLNKLVGSALFLFAVLINAQPPNPGGGGGGVGPGAPASPIDMYVYGLGIISVLLIAFYTKRYKNQKV
ncbi:signal peptidase [Chryseobacterium nematophagum]|uniref:Signal peptidase n=1 Tax=Chryseobacterium nematophagum TaxID=2305228 RepID=A0A3M7LEJ1_9FLAO|nr:signal peptidase [Chryseobacterium nematophagum]RMZ60494.1 signal peptidase [Chryseobacterium nematophagum]